MTDRLVSVAVPVPALGLLTYRVPADQPMPVRGARVVVPLGKRTLTGVVVGDGANFDRSFEIRDIREVLDDDAFVPADVVALTEWVSDYYLSGPGAALAAALPPHGLTGARRFVQDGPDRAADSGRPRCGGSADEQPALHQRHRPRCASHRNAPA